MKLTRPPILKSEMRPPAALTENGCKITSRYDKFEA
jgi:hypothetical protein